jgi:hypothetical protein
MWLIRYGNFMFMGPCIVNQCQKLSKKMRLCTIYYTGLLKMIFEVPGYAHWMAVTPTELVLWPKAVLPKHIYMAREVVTDGRTMERGVRTWLSGGVAHQVLLQVPHPRRWLGGGKQYRQLECRLKILCFLSWHTFCKFLNKFNVSWSVHLHIFQ